MQKCLEKDNQTPLGIIITVLSHGTDPVWLRASSLLPVSCLNQYFNMPTCTTSPDGEPSVANLCAHIY